MTEPATKCATDSSVIRSMIALTTLIAAGHGLRAVALRRAARACRRPRAGRRARPICLNIASSCCGFGLARGTRSARAAGSGTPRVCARRPPRCSAARSSSRHQLLELGRVLHDDRAAARDAASSRSSCGPASAAAMIWSIVAASALLLAQHFGVVDLLDLEARTAGRGPERARCRRRRALPRARASSRSRSVRHDSASAPALNVRRADEVPVQELGELDDRRVRARPSRRRR